MRVLPLTILIFFSVVDAAANWRVIPAQTVSEVVWSLGWLGRLGAGVTLALLFSHLVLQWPYGPESR
jgi:hypothetical protein